MQERFRQLSEAWVSLLGLLGITLNTESISPENTFAILAKFPEQSSGVHPDNLLTNPAPVKLEQQVEEKLAQ